MRVPGLLLLSSLLLIQLKGHAQQWNVQSDTIHWQASSFVDSVNNSTGVCTTQFITYGTTKIRWIPIQEEPQTEITFEVERLEGDWSSGKVLYYVLRNGKPRQLRIENLNGTVKLSFSYFDASNKRRMVEYHISEISKTHN